MHELDKIHQTYRRLKSIKLIPCNCSECKTGSDSYFYRYDRLPKFIEDKQVLIQCQHSYKMVNVPELIDGYFTRKPRSKSNYNRDDIMTKYEIKIERGASVGNIILGSAIQNSFNKVENAEIAGELKESLKELAQAVDVMIKVLPKEEGEEVASDFSTLVDESTRSQPRQKWYQLSAYGLIKAAENIGKIGTPVIELATKVVKLLMTI